MSSKIVIEIPREIIHATRMTPEELRRELAIYLSKYSRIPPSSAGGMNGLPSPLAASPEGPLARRGERACPVE